MRGVLVLLIPKERSSGPTATSCYVQCMACGPFESKLPAIVLHVSRRIHIATHCFQCATVDLRCWTSEIQVFYCDSILMVYISCCSSIASWISEIISNISQPSILCIYFVMYWKCYRLSIRIRKPLSSGAGFST